MAAGQASSLGALCRVIPIHWNLAPGSPRFTPGSDSSERARVSPRIHSPITPITTKGQSFSGLLEDAEKTDCQVI